MSSALTDRNAEVDLATYAYSYPHKSSYRKLDPPISIAEAWREEEVSQLSLYLHIPFCEMRCGFCNLFTQSQPEQGAVAEYLEALTRQMRVIRGAVPDAHFSQFAIGGGTPTFLSAAQLRRLMAAVETVLGQSIRELPTSIETSPATATVDRLRVLAEFGIQRISLGIQSFVEAEAKLFGRPQRREQVFHAIETIRRAGQFELNLDLIYGHPKQTHESWETSLKEALRYEPDELYLYPLYVRPETGLARKGMAGVAHRAELYDLAREILFEAGYEQLSLRCFRLPRIGKQMAYACQRDGMIGLGCGARSYTRRLHYATRFAVTQSGVRAILREWVKQSDEEFAQATHGIWLSDEEQCRRYVILSLLQVEGMSRRDFAERFAGVNFDHLSGVAELRDRGWLMESDDRERMTEIGLQHSDELGPLIYSKSVRENLRAFLQRNELAAELLT